MTKRALVAATCVLAGAAAATAEVRREASRPGKNQARVSARPLAPNAPQVVGTVQYDTAANSAGFFTGPAGLTVGNRFNTNMGGPLLGMGNLTMVTFFPRLSSMAGGAAFVSFFGPPDSMGTAEYYSVVVATGLVASQFNAATLSPAISVGPDFLVGLYHQAGIQQSVGMDNMTNPGQVGFHGFQANTHYFTAPYAATGFALVPNQNAMIRATGNILTPVELMNFTIK